MISIIISSANSTLLKNVSQNVAETIGVPYEIIATDNSGGQQGICTVYNKGLLKAKYDIVCFMHEDIFIKTNDWGKKILNSFEKNPDLGLLGVIGSAYKPMTPSGWGGLGSDSYYYNLIQHNKYSDEPTTHLYRNPNNEKLTQVACVDGVWLCTTRKIAREFMFDEINFTGFHVYDLDFSLSVGQKYKVAVTYDVLIEHFSEGKFDQKWMMDTLKLHEKWNSILPVNCESLSHEQVVHSEKATFKYFLKRLASLNLPLSHAFKMLRFNNRYLRLDTKLFFKLQYYIVMRYLNLKKI
ncbi:Glycosyltransferase like family protein [Mucilaginibacter pineti]|uniref:Glycosyltransferase like family protein n=1 Tax=Mucilaginibacter pineti TaxID=1391627 RepID=A0A1G7N1F1_9SPHI|nr:glycosyltransferase [Mucilaginibacter pineti]SDF67915.1 Glycosyltransferase like family protein [Mucilaginibacter pineti]